MAAEEDRWWVDVKCRERRQRNGRGGTSESGIMNNSERGEIRLAAVRTSAIQKPNSLVVPS